MSNVKKECIGCGTILDFNKIDWNPQDWKYCPMCSDTLKIIN